MCWHNWILINKEYIINNKPIFMYLYYIQLPILNYFDYLINYTDIFNMIDVRDKQSYLKFSKIFINDINDTPILKSL